METYKVELVDEIKSSSPHSAVRNTLFRIFEEEIAAKVTNLSTGEVVYIECQSGQVINSDE